MSILIIAPTQREFDTLSTALADRMPSAPPPRLDRVPALGYQDGTVVLAQGALGKAGFGVQTQYLIDRLKDVSLVVCAGAAGGLLRRVSVGDVVVATTTVEHDFNRRLSDRPLPSFEGHEPSISALRVIAGDLATGFDMHFEAVASGDEDIVEISRAEAIHEATGAVAFAWEGAGGARACSFSGVPFLELRSITDGPQEGRITEFGEFANNLPAAMGNLAKVLCQLPRLVSSR